MDIQNARSHAPLIHLEHNHDPAQNVPIKMEQLEGDSTTEMEMVYEAAAAASQGMLLCFRFLVVGWIIDFTII